MRKNKLAAALMCGFLSVLLFSACGSKNNTNLQSDTPSLGCQKWDQFALRVGLPTCSEAAPVSNQNAVVQNIEHPPANFIPNSSNTLQYENIKSLVNKYIASNVQYTQATQVVSIQPLATALAIAGKQADFADQSSNPNFVSIPFRRRSDRKIVDLSAIKTFSGVNSESRYKIYATRNGELDTTHFATGTVYIIEYQLGHDTKQNYSGMITIPDPPPQDSSAPQSNGQTLPVTFPLTLYSHGGDSGISFREIATIMQNNIANTIVAAPSFPGEPVCSITSTQGTASNGYFRSCEDANRNNTSPAVPPDGVKSPADRDIYSVLGIRSAISQLALGTLSPQIGQNYFRDASQNKIVEFYADQTIGAVPYLGDIVKKYTGPKTIGVSDSRGGATLLAAAGRSGLMINNMLTGQEDFTPPVLFSAEALHYAPTSFLVGQFRILAQYLMGAPLSAGSVFRGLPMVPDFAQNAYFSDYRNAPAGQDSSELDNFIGWIAASDITYIAPYMSVSTQNWTANINNIVSDSNLSPLFAILGQKSVGKFQITSLFPLLNSFILPAASAPPSEPIETIRPLPLYFAKDMDGYDPNNGLPTCDTSKESTTDCTVGGVLTKGATVHVLFETISVKPLLTAANLPLFQNFLNSLADNAPNFVKAVQGKETTNSQYVTRLKNILTTYSKLSPTLLTSSPLDFAEALFAIAYVDQVKYPSGSDVQKAMAAFYINFIVLDANPNLKDLENIDNWKTIGIDLVQHALGLRKAQPGSIIFIHGTQDQIVPFTESIIAKTVMDDVFDNVYGTNSASSPLVLNKIPAVGTQMYSFQPDVAYYNVPVGSLISSNTPCSSTNPDGSSPTNYSSLAQKCFGNFQGSLTGDGNEDHGTDSAFLTSHLLNGALQHMNVESSDLKNEMLYGSDNVPGSPYAFKTGSVTEQLGFFNYAYSANGQGSSGSSYPYASSPADCVHNPNGVCYLWNALDLAGKPTIGALPLYNRTMLQDETRQFAPMYTGAWDSNAQTQSQLSPSDVFSTWFNTVALEMK